MSEVKVLESIIEWCGGDKSCAYHASLHSELERYAHTKHDVQVSIIEQQQQRIAELEYHNKQLKELMSKLSKAWNCGDSVDVLIEVCAIENYVQEQLK